MCGVFGAIRLSGFCSPEAVDDFVDLTDLVSYRGPDDYGFVTIDIKRNLGQTSGAFDAFLGNRRLSILDLSAAGHQPMTDGLGHWITFNGEIFNFVELRKELESLGHQFTTGSDTEVILHVYAEYGESGFGKLNGMWAFAIVDVRARRVVLSRDRFSIKPLYWLRVQDCLYFGSEIKQLLPLLPKRELNMDVMARFLSQGLLDDSPETFFVSINRVEPKTNVVISVDTGTIQSQRYWDYADGSIASSRDPIEEFRALLLDSTSIRLRSDVPVGLLLSGGLDSSSLAAALRRLTGGKIETYSIISTGVNEEKYIDKTCLALGIENRKILFDQGNVLKNLERCLYHNDEPIGGFSVIAQFKLLEQIKTRGDVTVLLSGQGGDEALLGYLKFYFFHLRDLIRNHKYGKAIAEFLLSVVHRTAVRQFRLDTAKRYIPKMAARRCSFLRWPQKTVPVWEAKTLRHRQIDDIDRYSVPALTHYEDRNGSAHSLEIRHPFLDHRLVNFAINLPTNLKLGGGWTKRILRESFAELPPSVRWRRDKGYFGVPEERWLRAEMGSFVRKIFSNSILDQMGVLDSGAFLQAYNGFQNHRVDISPMDISRVLIAEIWAQQFLGNIPLSLSAGRLSQRKLAGAESSAQ